MSILVRRSTNARRGFGIPRELCRFRRGLLTLAIESSCDDSSVAILEKCSKSRTKLGSSNDSRKAILHFHEKVTADNSAYRGIHPIAALDSHQENVAKLVQKALSSLPFSGANQDDGLDRTGSAGERRKPDFVTVTRGPGMRSSLSVGLDTAKGLAVAWQIPLVAVNHMQAHALTPRLVSALSRNQDEVDNPKFPFLSLLVSGGHTLLLLSASLTDHQILASTSDIAIGDCIDKVARSVLPEAVLKESGDSMYGRVLEHFAFPGGINEHEYTAPASREKELARNPTKWGWSFGPPLAETKSGSRSKAMEYSFSGLASAAERFVANSAHDMSIEERVDLGREAMRVAFEHLASRVVMALHHLRQGDRSTAQALDTLVVSGGVASNQYLKTILRAFLDIRDYSHIGLSFPPPSLCTDNAAMIAWTGMEMFENGWESDLSCRPLRKWSMDPAADDGGILGISGWKQRGA
ncbi:glycoprotease family protein [Xylona heveae TC161]|uniref:Glycoprotease family protein n=1 Tax=Xylona heveae (strain CBS 132557 / TC161) TaxID=1328760 RepID=A0A165IK77_XYLHT|nr:glycoprotease family protein [Xylona heveae TC161]KZF25012.1 glycoprotease family protein [Xylona heveae TC161]